MYHTNKLKHSHEYASFEKINAFNAQELIKQFSFYEEDLFKINSKLKIISFFSEWCPNCHYEAVQLNKIYNDYNKKGLEQILVMDYSTKIKSDKFLKEHNIKINTIMGELETKDEKAIIETCFYNFRKKIFDDRKWGVPLHILITSDKEKSAYTVTGEIIYNEIEVFLKSLI